MSSKIAKKKLKAVDFFCGGGGMSYGMKTAGVKVLAGIDYESKCKETYEANIKGAKFLTKDVFEYQPEELESELNLKRDDNELIMIGCSPCQFWSIINTDRNKSKKSKNLLFEFQRFVKYFNPGYVIVENVPGVLTKKEESGLAQFNRWLKKHGYVVHVDIHNVKNYGVPQSRKRLTLIANRISEEELEPVKADKKLTVRDVLGLENGFPKINAGNIDKTDFAHTSPSFSDIMVKRFALIPKDGGNRMAFADHPELQLNCYKGKDDQFRDTYGRLWWDRPAPTITTKFYSVSNGRFAHPEEDRALSLREGATLQSFPKDYIFKSKTITDTARIIGNAVPPEYARRVALAIKQNHLNG